MPAEIYSTLLSDEEPHQMKAELLNDQGMFWTCDFGNAQGNPTFIHASKGIVKIFTGKITKQSGEGFTFQRISDIRQLQVGDSYQETLLDSEEHTLLLLVRNIGSRGIKFTFN